MTPDQISRAGILWLYGSSTHDIAHELFIKESEVHNHLAIIKREARKNRKEHLDHLKAKAVVHWGQYEATKCNSHLSQYNAVQKLISQFEYQSKRMNRSGDYAHGI